MEDRKEEEKKGMLMEVTGEWKENKRLDGWREGGKSELLEVRERIGGKVKAR